jgi:hypothetical protein
MGPPARAIVGAIAGFPPTAFHLAVTRFEHDAIEPEAVFAVTGATDHECHGENQRDNLHNESPAFEPDSKR